MDISVSRKTAWRCMWPRGAPVPEVVRELIARGAPVNAADCDGRTALQLAVKACVDSYWTERRSPDSIRALLDAGASTAGIELPTRLRRSRQVTPAAFGSPLTELGTCQIRGSNSRTPLADARGSNLCSESRTRNHPNDQLKAERKQRYCWHCSDAIPAPAYSARN